MSHKTPKRKKIIQVKDSSDSEPDDLPDIKLDLPPEPDDLPDIKLDLPPEPNYEKSKFVDIEEYLKTGFEKKIWDIFQKGELFRTLLKSNLLKNKNLSADDIVSIFELFRGNILSNIFTEKGKVQNISDIIVEQVSDTDKYNHLQDFVLTNFLDRFETLIATSSLEPYKTMIEKIFCDEEVDYFEDIIERLNLHIKRILSDCNIIWMIEAIHKDKIGKEQYLIQNINECFSYLYNFLYEIRDKVKDKDRFSNIFQIIVDFKLIYYLYDLYFKKEKKENFENLDINDYTSKYYCKSITTYKDFEIFDHKDSLSYSFSVIKKDMIKYKILELCKTLIILDKDTKINLENNKRTIQEKFDIIFKSYGTGGDKYKFISKSFLEIYEEDFPMQMCGIYNIYSIEDMANKFFPKDYDKIPPNELIKDNIFQQVKNILTSFIDLIGINLSIDDIYKTKLSFKNDSIISTELVKTLAKFIKDNPWFKYEPVSDEELIKLIEKPEPIKQQKKTQKPTAEKEKITKEKEKEKEKEKKEIEDTDETIRKILEKGNRDITNEIIENKENVLKFDEEIIKKIRTDFFHEEIDKEENIILNLPSTIQSTSNLDKIGQFVLFNLLKEYLIYVMSHYSSKNSEDLMILQGGACVQYYSKAKRITYDLDYKFYPKQTKKKMKLEEQLNFLKEYLLPFFKDINLDKIIKERNIICSSDTTGLSSLILQKIKDNLLKDFKLLFFYDERGIIKVYIQYTEICRDITGEREREEMKKHSILDISLSNPDDTRNLNLIKSILKKDSAQLPGKKDKKEIKLQNDLKIVLLNEDYLKNERDVLIEDSVKTIPEFITEVPGIEFNKTKEFIRNKMKEQLNALEKPLEEKSLEEKSLKKPVKKPVKSDGGKKNKKSLKRYIHKSIKKSIKRRTTLRKSKRLSRRTTTLRKSKKLSRRRTTLRKSKRLSRTTLRKSKRLSRTTLRKSKRLSRRRTTLRKSKRLSRKKIILV